MTFYRSVADPEMVYVCFIKSYIRMLQNKAQIPRENIKKSVSSFQALNRALDPGCDKGLHVPRSGCALGAHNLLRPLYLKILDPPLQMFLAIRPLVVQISDTNIIKSKWHFFFK